MYRKDKNQKSTPLGQRECSQQLKAAGTRGDHPRGLGLGWRGYRQPGKGRIDRSRDPATTPQTATWQHSCCGWAQVSKEWTGNQQIHFICNHVLHVTSCTTLFTGLGSRARLSPSPAHRDTHTHTWNLAWAHRWGSDQPALPPALPGWAPRTWPPPHGSWRGEKPPYLFFKGNIATRPPPLSNGVKNKTGPPEHKLRPSV